MADEITVAADTTRALHWLLRRGDDPFCLDLYSAIRDTYRRACLGETVTVTIEVRSKEERKANGGEVH